MSKEKEIIKDTFASVKAIRPIGLLQVGDTGTMDPYDAKEAEARGDVEIIKVAVGTAATKAAADAAAKADGEKGKK